jgi:hypothetical protein
LGDAGLGEGSKMEARCFSFSIGPHAYTDRQAIPAPTSRRRCQFGIDLVAMSGELFYALDFISKPPQSLRTTWHDERLHHVTTAWLVSPSTEA